MGILSDPGVDNMTRRTHGGAGGVGGEGGMRWAPIRCQEGGRTLTIITTAESITIGLGCIHLRTSIVWFLLSPVPDLGNLSCMNSPFLASLFFD